MNGNVQKQKEKSLKNNALIEVRDLCKTYFMAGNIQQDVLKNISFQIQSGEFVSIMGHSGSGKSTLMNILGCLDRPTSGTYILDGKIISEKNDSELALLRGQKIGFVFQNFNLLTKRTIVDNVSLPLLYQGIRADERFDKASSLLKKVQLEGYERHFPSQLSGGMQQRVAIARALINEPKIIFADEPTGNLDTQTSNEIMHLFLDLNQQGITIVLVTHEDDVADYAHRMIKIDDGCKVYDGLRQAYQKDFS